jgi:mycoredoxin
MFGASSAFGQLYEYKDANGNIVYTDSPPSGVEARKRTVTEERVFHSSHMPAAASAYSDKKDKLRSEEPTKKNYNRLNVVMYMTDWWGLCKKAREFMRSMGVDLVEYNIDKDSSKRDEARQKGGRGVPVIDIEGTIIVGYNPNAIKAALDQHAR